jgi:hypothetical protein
LLCDPVRRARRAWPEAGPADKLLRKHDRRLGKVTLRKIKHGAKGRILARIPPRIRSAIKGSRSAWWYEVTSPEQAGADPACSAHRSLRVRLALPPRIQ